MTKSITIDLLRHGEVQAKGWSFRGSTDVALSKKGLQQMLQQYAAMPTPFHKVISSPMQRCALFSQNIKQQTPENTLEICDGFKEMNFGDWEGQPLEAIEHDPELQRFWKDPTEVCPPNGEAFDDFQQRVLHTWHDWLEHDAEAEKHYLIVTHGGVIRILLAHFLGMPSPKLWAWDMPYASWSRVSHLKGFPTRVMFINR
ncbi:MAG: alpha-ribazole phosphatase family protein [Mariprofundaceae bacterium]|nr:alpha-ribazole phosphatase family protein [Mariprofundaceae bacterium]